MEVTPLFIAYNLASTSYIYGKFSPMLNARKFVKTTGSSTTVVEAATDDASWDEVDVGDQINVRRDGTVDTVYITAKASAASATVSASVNWDRTGGYPYQFRKFSSGTTASDGWVGADLASKAIHLQIDTLNADSIDVSIEGRTRAGAASQILTKNFTAATVASDLNSQEPIPISEDIEEIRVGFKLTNDTGANSVSAWLVGVPRNH